MRDRFINFIPAFLQGFAVAMYIFVFAGIVLGGLAGLFAVALTLNYLNQPSGNEKSDF